ncbi:MAG: hypothetical protein R2748_22185 [Bryobacterales bacterium]
MRSGTRRRTRADGRAEFECDPARFRSRGGVSLSADLDLFDEEAIHLQFDGETGPFTPKSSPAKGKLILDARPGRLPEKFRRDYMGEFLASPGGGSWAHLETDVQGDLLGTLVATGDLHIEDLQLGDPSVGQLPLSGEAPVLLTLIDPAANPTYDFVMPDASFRLGEGRWQGGLQVQFDGDRVRGEIPGCCERRGHQPDAQRLQ